MKIEAHEVRAGDRVRRGCYHPTLYVEEVRGDVDLWGKWGNGGPGGLLNLSPGTTLERVPDGPPEPGIIRAPRPSLASRVAALEAGR